MPDYVNNPDKITYFAETDYRSKRVKFGIRDDDRARHMYIIGKTGMGKSTLLENLAIQDIQNGEGVCFIDPHGGTAETLLSYVPEHRIKDVIYFAPFDQEFPVGLNVMEDMGRDKRPLVASGLMGAFKKVWVDAWSARMEYILNNAMLALMETPGSTLLGVNRIFADKAYRNQIVANVTDPSVKAFWVDEYAKYSDKFATEATAAIQNKVGQFAANPLIRNMVGQPRSTFDIRDVMDTRKIFIVNLSKGRMGEGNANLVGSMLITKIYLAAMSRADVGAENVKGLPPFYLYVDEFQSFANESFADILSEARKYKLALTIAHQYIEQMSDEVRAAVFGNVGTMISFRVGSYDADVLEKEFAPVFLAEDMVNLGFAQVYMKLMIRGIGSPPFSATTLNRPKLPPVNYAQEVIAASRKNFARPRAEVEEEIRKWHEPIPEAPRDPNAPPPPPETRKYAPGTRPVRPPMGAVPQRVFTPSGAPRSFDAPPSDMNRPRQTEQFDDVAEAQPVRQVSPRPTMVVPQAPYVAPVETIAPIGEEPIAEIVQPVHQPFKEVFAKVAVPAAPLVEIPKKEVFVPTPRAIERNDRTDRPPRTPAASAPPRTFTPTTPASLTSLKSQPKKDKGPSEGNMTNLKAALESVMMNARNMERMKAAEESMKKSSSPEQQITETRVEPKQAVPAPLVRESIPKQQPPKPSLLDEHPQTSSIREVPEDILRSVLAD